MGKKSKAKIIIEFIHFAVGIIFFFAWSDLWLNSTGFITEVLLFILGLLIPIILLVGVVQYKNRIAYGATLVVFLLGIFRNLFSLPYYIELYEVELSGGTPYCSCCPLCEIKTVIKLVSIFLIAILFMHNKKMLRIYKWKWFYLFYLFPAALLLHYLLRYLNWYY